MLQVFQRHVARVCLKCFIYFQMHVAIVFDLDVAYVATICFKYFSCFSLMLQKVVSCCKLLVFLFWMFHVFHTHIARAYFQIFHLF
jgi:hypothetical protein